MTKLVAEPRDAHALESLLAGLQLTHLRVRRRADVLTIESGPADDAYAHARLRRVTVQYWRLEMPTHSGKWELTPYRGQLGEVVRLLVESFPWTIAPLE